MLEPPTRSLCAAEPHPASRDQPSAVLRPSAWCSLPPEGAGQSLGAARRDWSLDAHFHHDFPSHEVGALKPDAEYFGHVIEALGVPAQRVLFVDDNAINVEAAAGLGIVAHRVAGVDGVRGVLTELGMSR